MLNYVMTWSGTLLNNTNIVDKAEIYSTMINTDMHLFITKEKL